MVHTHPLQVYFEESHTQIYVAINAKHVLSAEARWMRQCSAWSILTKFRQHILSDSECMTEAFLVQDRGLWWLVHDCLVVITGTDGSSQESWVWFSLAAGFSLLVFLTHTWSRRIGRTWRNFYSRINSDCGWHGNSFRRCHLCKKKKSCRKP